MLNKLSDDILISSYVKANSLDLDQYFIFLIEQELTKRELSSNVHNIQSGKVNAYKKFRKNV
ncbi:sporulation histidine kinase inhibitor Sda [Metabacillus halosaccharovorans]|uniref:sporulation histidine kinase inhibitor Sda n=1 Tax=Metabacillus halosaccharovorans TaxID=930124 RepID=UPI001C1FDE31|nr:sporulation histidine kinase inhibitor Sda [Metabacillus halosaccharovorans]MBU7591253.1 sporulation histidine kinase inhibitor Sda [Metabacillus halosaccharovorans]